MIISVVIGNAPDLALSERHISMFTRLKTFFKDLTRANALNRNPYAIDRRTPD